MSAEKSIMYRNLDRRYFPMQRNGKLVHVCFTDLKTYERDRVLKGQSVEWLEWLCRDLANALQEVGDKLDLSREGSSILLGEHPEIQNLSAEEQRPERLHRRRRKMIQ